MSPIPSPHFIFFLLSNFLSCLPFLRPFSVLHLPTLAFVSQIKGIFLNPPLTSWQQLCAPASLLAPLTPWEPISALENNVTTCHTEIFSDCFNLEYGIDKLFRNVCKQLKITLFSIPVKRKSKVLILHNSSLTLWRLTTTIVVVPHR